MRGRRPAAVALALWLSAACGACGDSGPRGGAGEPRGRAPPAEEPADTAAEAAGVGERPIGDREGGAAGGAAGSGFGPPVPDTLLRVGLLRLANRAERGVEVRASAGAAEVRVEEIQPGDSTLVEVAVRSDSVLLRAVDAANPALELDRSRVAVTPDTVRWEIR